MSTAIHQLRPGRYRRHKTKSLLGLHRSVIVVAWHFSDSIPRGLQLGNSLGDDPSPLKGMANARLSDERATPEAAINRASGIPQALNAIFCKARMIKIYSPND